MRFLVCVFVFLQQSLEESKKQIDELEKEKLKGVPVDTAKEITKLQEKLVRLTEHMFESIKVHLCW